MASVPAVIAWDSEAIDFSPDRMTSVPDRMDPSAARIDSRAVS